MAVTLSALKPTLFVSPSESADAVQFYKAAFGAEEVSRDVRAETLSAQLKIGSTTFIVSDSNKSVPGTKCGCALCLETEDISAAVAKAVAAGAAEHGCGEEGACCGERVGKVTDPYGFVWLFCAPATHVAA